MGGSNAKIKKGMGGSNCGRGRWEYTEVLKSDSKTARREEGKKECADGVLEKDETLVLDAYDRVEDKLRIVDFINKRIQELVENRDVLLDEVYDIEQEYKLEYR